MKKTRKAISLALALLLMLSLFAACGGGDDKTSAPETGSPETQTPAGENPSVSANDSVTGAETTISLPLTTEEEVFSYFISYPPIMKNFVDEPYVDYSAWNELQRRTGVTIDWVLVSVVAETETFNIMINSGDYTDIIPSALFSNSLDFYVDEGVILDIKELSQENMPNYLKAAETYEELGEALGIESEKGYWSVIHKYVKDAATTTGLVIREDWLDDLSMDLPETYDEYYDVLTAFKVEKGADAPMWLHYTGVFQDDMFVAGFGINAYANVAGQVFHPFYQIDGVVGYGPYTEAYYEYLELMAKWYDEGLIYQDFISHKESNIDSAYATTGRTGIWVSQKTNIHEFEILSDNPNFKTSAVSNAVKSAEDGNHFLKTADVVTVAGTAIGGNCHNPELLLKFFDYCFSDEGSLLMNYGIEGEGFEYVDGEPQFTELVTNPQEIPAMSLAITVYTGGNEFAGIIETSRQNIAYTETQLDAENIWRINADSDYRIPPLVAMNEEESEAFNADIADITTYVSEFTLSVITGVTTLTPETFAKYQETLRQMGVEDCIAAKQSSMDRYLEKIG